MAYDKQIYSEAGGRRRDGLGNPDDKLRYEVEEEPSELDGFAQAYDSEDLDEDDLESMRGVRTSGGSDVSVMSRSDRKREFPSMPRVAGRRDSKKPAKRRAGARPPSRRSQRRGSRRG